MQAINYSITLISTRIFCIIFKPSFRSFKFYKDEFCHVTTDSSTVPHPLFVRAASRSIAFPLSPAPPLFFH